MPRLLAAALAATLLALLPPLPTVHPNDNRVPAGRLRAGVLTIRLVVRMARWYPEAKDGPSTDVATFAEEGHAPEVPGPLIRVPDSTVLTWRPLAKDGADLPAALAVTGPARRRLGVGETFDAEFTPPAAGEYLLTMGPPGKQMVYVRRLIVR